MIFFIWDKLNMHNVYTVPGLGKFAFVQGKIVNIYHLVKANDKVSL